eukprot:3166937-Rhodomonas_salina.2
MTSADSRTSSVQPSASWWPLRASSRSVSARKCGDDMVAMSAAEPAAPDSALNSTDTPSCATSKSVLATLCVHPASLPSPDSSPSPVEADPVPKTTP